MSHFYGVLEGSRGKATRGGNKRSGFKSTAASWEGCITVELEHDDGTGEDRYIIHQKPWQGKGVSQTIVVGVLGKRLPE